MKIEPGTQHEERKKIANYVSSNQSYYELQGVQKLPPNNNQKGNHFVTIKIVIPKKLSEEQKKVMEAFSKVEDVPQQTPVKD